MGNTLVPGVDVVTPSEAMAAAKVDVLASSGSEMSDHSF